MFIFIFSSVYVCSDIGTANKHIGTSEMKLNDSQVDHVKLSIYITSAVFVYL